MLWRLMFHDCAFVTHNSGTFCFVFASQTLFSPLSFCCKLPGFWCFTLPYLWNIIPIAICNLLIFKFLSGQHCRKRLFFVRETRRHTGRVHPPPTPWTCGGYAAGGERPGWACSTTRPALVHAATGRDGERLTHTGKDSPGPFRTRHAPPRLIYIMYKSTD